MDCRDCQRLLSDYLDETLLRESSDEMRDHLASCRACQSELLLLRKMDDALRNQVLIEPPSDFTRRLLDSLPGAEIPVRSALLWGNLWPLRWPALAAGLTFLAWILRVRIGSSVARLSANLTTTLQDATGATFDWLRGFPARPFPSISPQVLTILNVAICVVFVTWSFWLVGRTVRALRA